MKNQVIIIDDFISQRGQAIIEQLFIGSQFPWMYQQNANYPAGYEQTDDTHQFNHSFVKNAEIVSDYYKDVSPIFEELKETFPVDMLFRAKVNMTLFDKANIPYNTPHRDNPDLNNYYIGIYYVNDSDGDTYIFNETEPSSNYTVKLRVPPKRGRLVVFDGKFMHSGNTPRENKTRIIINMNFTLKINYGELNG